MLNNRGKETGNEQKNGQSYYYRLRESIVNINQPNHVEQNKSANLTPSYGTNYLTVSNTSDNTTR